MPTTFSDPDGWPRPRAPQHAAARLSLPWLPRLQASRVLRLFATAGIWAAGLCLVIGLLVLVASAAPGPAASLSAASSAQHDRDHGATRPGRTGGGSADSPGHRAPAAGSGVLAVFAGRGDATTRQFLVSTAASWQIQWSYQCPASMSAGLMVVEDADPAADGASISESGAAGRGDTWLNPEGGTHHLVVISTCSWTMKVMQRP
jgi:hypothetical protein